MDAPVVGKLLVVLVSLSGHQDDVAGGGLHHGGVDGGGAVEDDVGLHGGVDGDAGLDVLGDVGGVFVARVVRGDDESVRAAGGLASHLRALAVVAVASGAGDGHHGGAAGADGTDGVEDVGNGVGGVGIVHHHRHAVVRAEPLEASRHGHEAAQRQGGLGGGSTHQAQGAVDGQQVVAVELAGEVGLHLDAVDAHQGAVDAVFDVAAAEVGVSAHRVGVAGGAGVLQHHQAVRVVGVDEGPGRGGEVVEQTLLGGEVGVEGFVVVEVVAGEVGEDAAGEVQAGGALLHLTVARALHGGEGAALVHHHRQQAVYLQGRGCGVGGGEALVADAVLDGTEQSGLMSGHPRGLVQ